MVNSVMPTKKQLENFRQEVFAYYHEHKRSTLPWRKIEDDGSINAYHVMVSEIMLQQTQVSRVVSKFEQFIEQYPTVKTLSDAPLADVITLWSGLGYNRRAKFLHEAANIIVKVHSGNVPPTIKELVTLPGIGHNTAAAIVAYSINKPVVFVETNIRTVFLHHFFQNELTVHDKQIEALLYQISEKDDSRTWYWALMDYGSYLKKQTVQSHKKSKHYVKQSVFEGSRRQVRGQILKLLITKPHSFFELNEAIDDLRLSEVLKSLVTEKLITYSDGVYKLGK